MKRMTAWLLIAGLLLQNAVPVQAADVSAGYDDSGQSLAGKVVGQTKEDTELQSESATVPVTESGEQQAGEAKASTPATEQTKEKDSSSAKVSNETHNGNGNVKNETQESKETKKTTETTETKETTESTATKESKDTQKEVKWEDLYAPEDGKGGLELTIGNAIPLERSVEFQVSVSLEAQGKNETQTLTLNPEETQKEVSFDNLSNGTYKIQVTADGFATYTQEVAVQGVIKSAEIDTGVLSLENVTYQEDSVHPGVILIGDADGDGSLTEQDKDAILDAASGIGTATWADLNGDGKVDIVDLQYYTTSWKQMQSGIHTQASFTSRVAAEAVSVQANANTKVEGDLQSLLSESGTVTLANADGEAISKEHPIEVGIALQNQAQEAAGEYVPMEEIAITTGANGIQDGEIVLQTKDGEETYVIENGKVVSPAAKAAKNQSEIAVQSAEETLRINLGGQIAVKRVIIRVTGAKGNNNLVDISKVEFLNDCENRIPEPEMDIPQNLAAKGANKSFTLTWDKSKNVTGYEVEISYDGATEVIRTATNTLKVSLFQNEELVNREKYNVRVQATNGNWKSGYGETIQAVPKLEGRPDAPDYVKATGGYQKIQVSWKEMEDTESYLVYYREKGTDQYEKSEAVTKTSYEITGLKDKTTYQLYVTGVNELGESDPSLTSEATTTFIKPAIMPKYKLLNESNGIGKVTQHIVSVRHPRGKMVDSPLDADSSDSALGVVDDDFGSYYQVGDWDEGGAYPARGKGIYFTFDKQYEMNYIAFAEVEDVGSYTGGSFYYYDETHQKESRADIASVLQKTDANGRKYYVMKLASPIKSDMVRIGFTRYGNYRNIVIAEVNFYYYDSLEDDVLALYADDLHTQLKADVTEKEIEALQKRLDTKDEKSGEYHPERESIQKELDNAKGLLDTSLGDTIPISSQITAAKDGHLGFSGLNAWQPLGVSAYAGEQVVIYVGHNSLKTGSNTSLKLIATQYHAESSTVKTEVANLKVGRNEVTIPKLQSLSAEGGGALYVQYTGNNAKDQYAVRVSGGVKIPVLNLYGVTDESQRLEKVEAYVKELDEHVSQIEKLHEKKHETAEEGTGAKYDYDKQNCIAGATDIMLDQMMYSVSAEQIAKALGSGNVTTRAKKLDQSLKAMDQMMVLFYQHKGLTDDATASAKDRLPSQHLNIRYMRMFAGAFMYAAGDHIGIEWGSVGGLATAVPVESENGKYVSGNLFGWGIAHEVGHNINQGAYAVAEITNNYFAQLTTARDTNESVRFKYKNVYEKVTSNTIGSSDNQATQLAMYWQLHLAYDRGYNFKTYDTYEEQFNNLFYARVDTYARDTSRAPAPGGVALKLEGDKDQIFMRLSCAAAKADLTEYFTRWGMVPNEGTLAYAQQFAKEERAIYYANDDARVYEIENGTDGNIKDQDVIEDSSTATVNAQVPNEVNLTIKGNMDANVLSGYEIVRYTYEGGEKTREVVGFAPAEDGTATVEWQDHVSTLNNRVVTYEAIAVDKFGYYSAAKQIGDVRISHDGSLDKTMWSVTTNMTSKEDETNDATEQDPCEPEEKPAVMRVIDNDYSDNTYIGKADKEDAYVTIAMKQSLAVSALKYTVAEGDGMDAFTIEVSEDGKNWTTVREGSFEDKKGSQTVYFQNENKDPWVATYDASYVRLTAKNTAGKNVAITELDVLGPTGDSISLGIKADNINSAVGILDKEYEYEEGKVIPAGSLVFMGKYKGNPAYNVVLLYDEEGNIVGGEAEDGSIQAEQIILAEVPKNGLLGEVSDGTWIYWIAPDADGKVPSVTGKVRAELYRVDNAITNEGQRLVSDTLPMQMPDTLEKIEFEAE